LPGAPWAIASAALFGASTPFAKLLLGDGISPWPLAGLLYLGSGIGLSIIHLGRCALDLASAEAPLEERSAWFILAFAGSCGLGSAYGFLQGAWPFGLIEAIWGLVALRRWHHAHKA
jgi:hypothetical protein